MTWYNDQVMKEVRVVSKSVFKAQALQFLGEVELTGEPIAITDRGRPALRLLPYAQESNEENLDSLRGT